jgi:rare lipoprotein A
MRIFSTMAVAIVSAWMGVHANAAAAQSFDDRWFIIPKAHAEPAETDRRTETPLQTETPIAPPTEQPRSPIAAGPTKDRSAVRSFRRSFAGRASFYSYRTGKTANGSSFDRDLPTAAHRSLPFGTRVRVTNLANHKSVTVTITDRGPKAPDRVLDLSLGAARTLGITDRDGVAQVRGEVL